MPLLRQVRSSCLSWFFSQSRQESYRTLSQAPGRTLLKGQEQGNLLLLLSLSELRCCPLRCCCDGMAYPRSPFSPSHDSPNQMALLCLLTTQKGWPRSNESSSLVSQLVKSLPAIRETRVQSLGQEDPLEKEITIHYSVLAWRIPWTEEPGGLQSMG